MPKEEKRHPKGAKGKPKVPKEIQVFLMVPDRKKHKYMAAIETWERKPTHALVEVQQLHGKLLHVSLVVPAGRAYLTSLEYTVHGSVRTFSDLGPDRTEPTGPGFGPM